MNKLCLLGAAALIATAFFPTWLLHAVVEACAAVVAVASMVAGWAVVSAVVQWAAAFAGVQSAAAFGEAR